MRPTWNTVTRFEPEANRAGSTSVACWLCGFVNWSELSWVSGTGGWLGVVPPEEDELPPPPQPELSRRPMALRAVMHKMNRDFMALTAHAERSSILALNAIRCQW